ncbi:GGDEF domain-containing protein [Psychrobacter sp. I-STPA6b]|uniref:GGDEF domain-containing protein n=1 Tax=Psychrobacter sp. I-STPA6b TaxID=2585718 RepID=UPI001D0C46F1|nr:GGDEF domain-containing protein [Psychrobacter sp. I-STPA6b]
MTMIIDTYRDVRAYLSQIFLDWQPTDKAALFGMLVLIEILMHWLWLLAIWIFESSVIPFVDVSLIPSLWIGCSLFIFIFVGFVKKFASIKQDPQAVYLYQFLLFFTYCIYMAIVIKLVGQGSLVSGVALMGGTILAMMLIDRRIVWWGFLIQCVLIMAYISLPYCHVELPSLKRTILFTVLYEEKSTQDIVWWTSELSVARLPELMPQRGQLFWYLCYIYFALPKAILIIYVMRQLLEVFDANKASFQYKAEHDDLTDLKNRFSIYECMQHQICHESNHEDLSIILMDLDHFKLINDHYGHLVGDMVLKRVAMLLMNRLPSSCTAGRYGGEEFLLVLPNCPQSLAVDIANELCEALAEMPLVVDMDTTVSLTASFGVSTLQIQDVQKAQQHCQVMVSSQKASESEVVSNTSAVDDILKRLVGQADKALYQAKSLGRNQVQAVGFYDTVPHDAT